VTERNNNKQPEDPKADRSGDGQGDDGPAIRVVDLVKRFGEKTVLDRVNLEIRPAETMVIMGGSGCGKSTLLRLIIGSLLPEEGHVELLGRNILEADESELDELRQRFGILFQSGALLNSMTVGENVALPLREHTDLDEDTIEIMVRIKLELVGLRHANDLMPAEISGGMKKRAGLARAIALDPEILFYDEPSAGLDPVTSAEIDQLIIDLSSKLGVTSVVVTHEMDSAFRIADRMAMLHQGKILEVADRSRFEEICMGEPTGDQRVDLIRQFLRGDADGPLAKSSMNEEYQRDIFEAAES
jgi:phospholipid/cholesterol/gamma-HCH transport system ATP-binding protein